MHKLKFYQQKLKFFHPKSLKSDTQNSILNNLNPQTLNFNLKTLISLHEHLLKIKDWTSKFDFLTPL